MFYSNTFSKWNFYKTFPSGSFSLLKGVFLQTHISSECEGVVKEISAHSGPSFLLSFSAQKNTHYLLVFDGFVILVCITSAVLCTRSIILAVGLLQVSYNKENVFCYVFAAAVHLSVSFYTWLTIIGRNLHLSKRTFWNKTSVIKFILSKYLTFTIWTCWPPFPVIFFLLGIKFKLLTFFFFSTRDSLDSFKRTLIVKCVRTTKASSWMAGTFWSLSVTCWQ